MRLGNVGLIVVPFFPAMILFLVLNMVGVNFFWSFSSGLILLIALAIVAWRYYDPSGGRDK